MSQLRHRMPDRIHDTGLGPTVLARDDLDRLARLREALARRWRGLHDVDRVEPRCVDRLIGIKELFVVLFTAGVGWREKTGPAPRRSLGEQRARLGRRFARAGDGLQPSECEHPT